MAQGRGGATQATMANGLVMLALLLVNGELAKSEEYTVGDEKGWDSEGVKNWPIGKTFLAGDILEFKYRTEYHNVVKVELDGYESCNSQNAIRTYTSGDDRITLESGTQYFICGRSSFCTNWNMKIEVKAQ